jgi:hypothetical protein
VTLAYGSSNQPAGTLLNGKPAAASAAQGSRAIVANALEYAVERKLLAP